VDERRADDLQAGGMRAIDNLLVAGNHSRGGRGLRTYIVRPFKEDHVRGARPAEHIIIQPVQRWRTC